MGNLDEILEKFENGERRYNEDPIFKVAIQPLVAGLGVYAVLDSVLKTTKLAHGNITRLSAELLESRQARTNLEEENARLRAELEQAQNQIDKLY